MLSALITSQRGYPTMLLAEQLVHQWLVHPGPLVLGTNLFNFPTPTEDRDRTVSRRSEPSSRTALNGEQPYPWDRLQPQDAMSRHRGAKPPRRCELLGEISLLSPAYLLSFVRQTERSGYKALSEEYKFTQGSWESMFEGGFWVLDVPASVTIDLGYEVRNITGIYLRANNSSMWIS